MIKKLLRNIRQKPKAVREQYAFWIACTLTSMVALVWVATTMGQFDTPAESGEVTGVEPDTISSFMDVAQNRIDAVQQEVQDILPANQPKDSIAVGTDAAATSSDQADAVMTTPPVAARQEIRIATTSATSSGDD